MAQLLKKSCFVFGVILPHEKAPWKMLLYWSIGFFQLWYRGCGSSKTSGFLNVPYFFWGVPPYLIISIRRY